MVLKNLHGSDILGIDIVGGDAVTALQQVHALHIELRNALSVEFDTTISTNLYAWHAFQDISYHSVTLLTIGGDVIAQRVTILANLLCLDHHLLKLEDFFLGTEGNLLRTIRNSLRMIADCQPGSRNHHRVRIRLKRQLIVTLAVNVRVGKDAARFLISYGNISLDGLTLCIEHRATDDGLSLQTILPYRHQ